MSVGQESGSSAQGLSLVAVKVSAGLGSHQKAQRGRLPVPSITAVGWIRMQFLWALVRPWLRDAGHTDVADVAAWSRVQAEAAAESVSQVQVTVFCNVIPK